MKNLKLVRKMNQPNMTHVFLIANGIEDVDREKLSMPLIGQRVNISERKERERERESQTKKEIYLLILNK